MAQTTEAINFNKEENEFVLVAKKRLRNYKKKMANIAAIEAKLANKEKIVKEQEDALKTKDTTAKIIQELENVESQLLEVKQTESQKQFSLEDVKTLIALMQTQGQVKKVEGVSDQQLKHVQSSANSLLRPSSKWSADDTVKHALKLVRDQSIKSALAKIAAEEAKQEPVADKAVSAPTPVAPVVETPAPVATEAPKETAPAPAPAPETPKEAPAPATTESKESSEDSAEGKEKPFRRGGGNSRGRKPRGNGERGGARSERGERPERSDKPRNYNNKPRGGNKPQPTN